MISSWLVAHAPSLAHGLAAAGISIAVFWLAGLLLLPRSWSSTARWPDSLVVGLTIYVVLCWVATSSRNIPLSYVMGVFAAVIWAAMSLRFRWLQAMSGTGPPSAGARRWVVEFSMLYVLAYALARPSAGALLTMGEQSGVDLVTYARYAKHLLAVGTANLDAVSFEYLRSPASVYVLAGHSLPFVADPLDAAMPTLYLLTALFGMIAADVARSAWGLSRRGSMAIAALAVCAPMFRWTITTYALGELLAAMAVMYLMGAVTAAAASRRVTLPRVVGIAAGCTLLYFAGRGSIRTPGLIASGVAEMVRYFSLLAVIGLPGRSAAHDAPEVLRSAAIVLLPLVPLVWSAAVYAVRQSSVVNRVTTSPSDRGLARALIVYVGAAVLIGNVTVHAVASSPRQRWSSAWRQLAEAGRMPFRAVTLLLTDEPNGVSAALALYYLPVRKAELIERGIPANDVRFDTVSRQQPMFIQNFGCEGVGHDDTVSAGSVGCLLMEPPSMTVGTSYPFNRTVLFMQFDRMTARERGGRWNTHSTLNLKLTADPQRAPLDREMYVNLLVHTFLPAGGESLRLVLRWGRDRRGEVAVTDQQWFSLAVGSTDWSGNRLWTTPVAIDFPDGRTILFQEVALTETPRGPLAQPSQAAP